MARRGAKRPYSLLDDASDKENVILSKPGVSVKKAEPSTSGPSQGHRWRGWGDAGDAFKSGSPNPSGWKTEANPDSFRPPPRFTPKRTPGVQPPLNVGNPSPSEIFSHFFDGEVYMLLCDSTNKYAAKNLEQGKKYRWTKITPKEMKSYVGMLLYMSVLDLPKMTDFWRVKSIFHVAFPATIMTRDRFLAITASVHLSNPTEDAKNERKKGTEDYDHLHQVRPLLEMTRIRCKAIYHPKQHISVNERTVVTKLKGLKFFVLADVNGYTLDFNIYTGKSKFTSGMGLSFDAVAGLVKKDYLGSGYVVYMDNFYTSPLLFRHLGQQGFGACGTYTHGRVGVPKTQENALTKKSPRGTIRWIRDRDLLFVKWMDTREVSLCTNVHPVYSGDTVQCWQKTGDGKRRMISIPRPTAVTEYNKYRGGVDTSNQMLGTNSVHRKTRRWPITVFQHVLDIAVTNSYVIHKELCASSQRKCMTRQQFQEELCANLFGVPLDSAPQKTPTLNSNPQKTPTLNSNPQKTPSHNHLPVPTSSGQEKSMVASMGRRKCKLCNKSTPWECEQCNVGLCLVPARNCFREFHKALKPCDMGQCLQPEKGDKETPVNSLGGRTKKAHTLSYPSCYVKLTRL